MDMPDVHTAYLLLWRGMKSPLHTFQQQANDLPSCIADGPKQAHTVAEVTIMVRKKYDFTTIRHLNGNTVQYILIIAE